MENRPDLTAEPDRVLLDAARAGDYSAFEILADRHAPRIYQLAHRILGRAEDAEDVVQTTFLKALEHLHQFRGESSLATWLRRIATNTALNLLRKRRGLPMAGPLPGSNEPDEPPSRPERIIDWRADVDQQVQRREVRQFLEQAIAELDDKYRLVFVLRDIEGLSVQQTAEQLGISPANVKVRLMRARMMLRDRLTDLFGHGPILQPPDHHGPAWDSARPAH